ncbi:hypothetical protein IL306_009500 [Fusarium sp. DS 682]|nr:hypothetical protein IL306_009500 [Fusarium sp. DS 682]
MVRYRVDARAGVHEKARLPENARGFVNANCELSNDNHAVNYITVNIGEPALNDYRQFNQDVVNQWRQESADSGGGCDVDSGF